MAWEPRPYNWFMLEAVTNLLRLLGIENPTDEQCETTERFVKSVNGYAHSTLGR